MKKKLVLASGLLAVLAGSAYFVTKKIIKSKIEEEENVEYHNVKEVIVKYIGDKKCLVSYIDEEDKTIHTHIIRDSFEDDIFINEEEDLTGKIHCYNFIT